MEHQVFKFKKAGMHTKPDNYDLAYYDPGTKIFVYYACSLFVTGKNSYYLEGPDEEFKKYIDKTIKHFENQLVYFTGRENEERGTYSTIPVFVDLNDPEFYFAFDRTFGGRYRTGNYYYTTNILGNEDGYQKVDSIEDVKRLDREYADVKIRKEEEKLKEQAELKKFRKVHKLNS